MRLTLRYLLTLSLFISSVSSALAESDYQLTLTELSVSETRQDGKPWDLGVGKGKQPDLYASVSVNGGYVLQRAFAKDSATVTPQAKSKSFDFKDNMLVNVVIYDKDMSSDDLIGSLHFKISEDDLNQTLTYQGGLINKVSFTLSLTRAGREARARRVAEAEAAAAKQAAQSAEAKAAVADQEAHSAKTQAEEAKRNAERAQERATQEAQARAEAEEKANKAKRANQKLKTSIEKVKEAQAELDKAIKSTEEP